MWMEVILFRQRPLKFFLIILRFSFLFPKNSPKNKYPSVFPKNIPRNEFPYWIWEDFLPFSPKNYLFKGIFPKNSSQKRLFYFSPCPAWNPLCIFLRISLCIFFFLFFSKNSYYSFFILFPSRLSCSFKDGRIWHLLCEMSFGNPLFFRFFFFSVFFSIKKTLLRIIPLQGFWGIFFYFYSWLFTLFWGGFFVFSKWN